MNENPNQGQGSPVKLSDEELMHLYRAEANEQAFEELYSRHASRVYGFLARRLPVGPELDEIHQAVFLKFHQSRHLYDSKYAVLQWLFVIARTTLTDHLRKSQRAVVTSNNDEAWQQAELASLEERQDSSSDSDLPSLDSLSERERNVVTLRVIDELSYEDIAARVGQTEASVRQILSRALKKLRLSVAAKGAAR
jgi:RNA polymerase sigma-70 factor (ECF subfamily)